LYFEDTGLRNARLNFRQIEETHLMENIIYNELRYRGYNVDVGVVEFREKTAEGKDIRKQVEIDFVANQGSKRYYIQSAYNIPDEKNGSRKPVLLKRLMTLSKKLLWWKKALNHEEMIKGML
jgi:predicted AAA+ superfamily ATPase